MGNANHLTGAKCPQGGRSAGPVQNRSGFRDDKTGLTIYVKWISGSKHTVFYINKRNAVDGNIRRRLRAESWSCNNQKSIGLWRNAPGHAGRKNSSYPHSFPDIAQAERASKGV